MGLNLNGEGGYYLLEDDKAAVKNLQRWLRELSREYEEIPVVFIDGLYGDETRDAVKAVQGKYGLQPTGDTDFLTYNTVYEEFLKLNKKDELLGYSPDFDSFSDKRISLGDELDDIFVLQALLNIIAVDDERYYVKPSGKYDRETEASVNLFRRTRGKEESGFVDRELWNDLVRVTRKPQYYT